MICTRSSLSEHGPGSILEMLEGASRGEERETGGAGRTHKQASRSPPCLLHLRIKRGRSKTDHCTHKTLNQGSLWMTQSHKFQRSHYVGSKVMMNSGLNRLGLDKNK